MQLPGRLIIEEFSDKRWEDRHWRWMPPAVPDFAKPSDLATVLVSYRQKHREIEKLIGRRLETFGDISDGSLETLLDFAYRTSFVRDEGRQVVARLHVPEVVTPFVPNPHDEGRVLPREFFEQLFHHWAEQRKEQLAERVIHRFQEPKPLEDRKVVARLAQTLLSEDSALVLHEVDGKIQMVGVCTLDDNDCDHRLLQMPGLWDRSGLLIHILGPGDLRVSEGRAEYTLRANELLIHRPAWFVEPAREWLCQVSNRLVKECERWPHWDPQSPDAQLLVFDDFPSSDVIMIWRRILREAITIRHGGAFVVVPDIVDAPVDMRFKLNPYDLGQDLVRAWKALNVAINNKSPDDPLRPIEQKRLAVHRLLKVTRSIAALSGTDGAVVLDRQMVLHGFGASIAANAGPLPTYCRDLTADSAIPTEQLLARFGERHKSALGLVAQLRGAIVFVVSQDGDLRLFASDANQVYFADHLQP